MRIVENTTKWIAISLIVILFGIIGMFVMKPNYGIDFQGGTIIHLDIKNDFKLDDIRGILDENNVGSSSVMKAGQDRTEVIIKMTSSEEEDTLSSNVINAIAEKYELDIQKDLLSTENIDPAIGNELKTNAFWAVIIACLGMLIYIWFRFEFMSGVAAIIALIHDVLIMFALVILLRVQINTPFVAALLTIIGYSINDTIVVFDRIRENSKRMKKERWTNIVNTSIKQTMIRTINTSATTLIVITLVYVLGVPSIKEFALPLIIGFISGTYSSIFIASPIWALWNERRKSRGESVYVAN